VTARLGGATPPLLALLLWVGLARAALGFPLGSPAPAPQVTHEAARVSMGCTFALVLHGADPHVLERAATEALDEVDRLDRLMSHFRADSALSLVNREAGERPVTVDPELFTFLERSLGWARRSGGAFDPTVGPLLAVWGFHGADGRMPTLTAQRRARAAVGFRGVALDAGDRSVRFLRPGMALDLGGIGKGYAVDRAVAVLRRHGVTRALVSAGGSSIYGLGQPPDAAEWPVRIQPGPGLPERTVHLRSRALAVSGSATRAFTHKGQRYGHVFDPRNGRPVRDVQAVLILADNATDADALDQVVAVLEPRRAAALLPPDTEATVFAQGRELQLRPRAREASSTHTPRH
jgi:thiamine biosynthesis lipoprotein